MKHDIISDMFSILSNGDVMGKTEILVPRSKLAKEILLLLQRYEYVGEFEEVVNNQGGCLKIKLVGKINKCGVIRPRISVEADDFEKYERRFLVAKGVGFLILSTSNGLLTHNEAKEKKIGGVLLGYIY